MSTYNSMSGLPTGASSSEAMAMSFGTAHSQSMSMDVFDQDMTFDESLLYVLHSITLATRAQPWILSS
jgi:hypothetical protein